jgi:hypothetical protein
MHAEQPATEGDYVGATSEELASHPGLLIDLAFALVPRRVAAVWGLLCLLGGNSQDKVTSLRAALAKAQERLKLTAAHGTFDQQVHAARDVFEWLAKLEAAVFTLVIARTRRGLAVAPACASA